MRTNFVITPPTRSQLAALVALIGMLPVLASASVMQSASYSIGFDSINAGGALATSTSYRIQDTTGETATGASTSTSYRLSAGYQQADPVTIAITAPTTITLTPLSVTQNSAVGTGAWTVTTNDTNGYTLTLNATTTPAMTNGVASFADYGTSTVTTWSVSNAYKYGFSVFGSATTGYGSGATCTASTDVPSTTLQWRGFYGTNTIQDASSSAPTSQSGVVTTLCVTDAQNVVLAPSGNYTATVVATATAL